MWNSGRINWGRTCSVRIYEEGGRLPRSSSYFSVTWEVLFPSVFFKVKTSPSPARGWSGMRRSTQFPPWAGPPHPSRSLGPRQKNRRAMLGSLCLPSLWLAPSSGCLPGWCAFGMLYVDVLVVSLEEIGTLPPIAFFGLINSATSDPKQRIVLICFFLFLFLRLSQKKKNKKQK